MQVVQPKGEALGENTEVVQREQPLKVELPDSVPGPAHKKVTRRSRCLSENKDVHAAIFNNQAQKELLNRGPLSELSYNHYTPLKSGHTLEEFHRTTKEETEYTKLQEMALLYGQGEKAEWRNSRMDITINLHIGIIVFTDSWAPTALR